MATDKKARPGRKKAGRTSSAKSGKAGEKTSPVDETTGEVTAIKEPFHVVGLGASAGGLETLVKFFTNMPPDSGMAFVVVVHLDPNHETMLPELLARHTRMEVILCADGMPVEPNRIHVIPANRDMTIQGGQLHLEEPLAPRGMRHNIDLFFRSLANEMEENAIAVILSGTGTDGTQGVKAVKEAGGIVVVQEENDAKYPGMPHSASATGVADLVIPVDKMPESILEITSRAPALDRKASAKDVSEHLGAIFRIVHARTGHDFSCYKFNTVRRRIERRMAVNDVDSIDGYVALLNEDHDEALTLFKEILIGVTSFFRDPEAFEYLEKTIIPKILENRDPEEPVRVWLAGCATGEEAYSIAILLREYADRHRLDVRFQLFATDIDERAIEFGRAGKYPDSISVDVNPERLRSFFRKTDNSYQVVKPLREMLVFAQHNVIKDPPFSKLDLLVCRNLLIYLNPAIQKRLIPLFFQAIKPNGYLFLGTSESVGDNNDLFRILEKKWKVFQRKATGRRAGIDFPYRAPMRPAAETRAETVGHDDAINPGLLAEKILIQRYSPPCVVINEKFEIVYFSTRTNRFLEPPVGTPSLDILKLTREDLRPALRAGIHKALTNNAPVSYKRLKIITESGEEEVTLHVEPINDPASAKGLALVIFEPSGARVIQPSIPLSRPRALPQDDSAKDMMIHQLEEQLQVTNDELQSTVERLETANEELKSSNEELMSMNEEFQSTNEELETSREELQALNEELITVNAELENKVEELSQSNNDMENLLSSSEIAVIFLNRQFRIKRYSPAMAKIFNLIESDLGRPLHHISGKIDYPDLETDAEKVLDSLTVVEREIASREKDRHFLMRVLPYRTTDDVIDGIVITFVDITVRKQSEEDVQHIALFPQENPAPVLRIAADGTLLYANRAADAVLALWNCSAGETVPGEIRTELDAVLAHGQIHRLDVRCGATDYSLALVPISDRNYVNIYASDITERKRLEESLRQTAEKESQNRAEVEAILEAVPAAVLITHDRECKVITGNQAAYDMLRMPRGENTSKSNPDAPVAHFRVFQGGRELSSDELPIQRVARTGEALLNFEELVVFEDGESINIYGNVVPLLDSTGSTCGAVAAFIDFTDRSRSEEAIRVAKQSAEKANRAKSTFLANMSHELRTPLTAIMGMLHSLRETDLSQEQTTYQTLAFDASRTLLRLIDDLLDFSKIDAGKLDIEKIEFDLKQCIDNAVRLMTGKAESKGLSIEVHYPDHIARTVRGDCDRLHQVLMNLVGNAIKFSFDGPIRVDVDGPAPEETAPGTTAGFRIAVSDNGIGIPEKDLVRIFESFSQVEQSLARSHSGVGLGLAICKNLVELMGGTIAVQSEVGKGSTFTFTVRFEVVAKPERADNGAAADRESAVSPAARKILVTEDDETLRRVMKLMLDQNKVESVIVDSGEAMLEAVARERFDVILLDIQMPGMDGFEVFRRLRELEAGTERRTPVIALTAHALPEFRDRCLNAGMEGYISKPINVRKLFELIEKVTADPS